jgi:hypothetical protein
MHADGPPITDRMANRYILTHPECPQRIALGALPSDDDIKED